MATTDNRRLPMSTYTVIPCRDRGGLMKCLYLNAEGVIVPPDSLNCQAQGFSVDFLCIQGCLGGVPADTLGDLTLVEDAELLAAVAKTLGGTSVLPITFVADGQQRIVLPVMPGTRRGVILVFSVTTATGALELVATSDPEIKNGTDR